jgi:hypothetical protein
MEKEGDYQMWWLSAKGDGGGVQGGNMQQGCSLVSFRTLIRCRLHAYVR